MKAKVLVCPRCSTPLAEHDNHGFRAYEGLRIVSVERDYGSDSEPMEATAEAACGVCGAILELRWESAYVPIGQIKEF